MARLTDAFVLRCWQVAGRFRTDDDWRIEIVRIHDGERTVFRTFDEAWAWLRTQITGSESTHRDDHQAPKGGGET